MNSLLSEPTKEAPSKVNKNKSLNKKISFKIFPFLGDIFEISTEAFFIFPSQYCQSILVLESSGRVSTFFL